MAVKRRSKALTVADLKRGIVERDAQVARYRMALERCLPFLDAAAGHGIEIEREDDGLSHDPATILGAMAEVLGFDGDSGAMFHHFCPEYAPLASGQGEAQEDNDAQ